MLVSIMLKLNIVLCLIGCVIAGLLGAWSRKSNRMRFIKALTVATLFSWIIIFGGLGGWAILPSIAMFCLAYPWVDPTNYTSASESLISNQIKEAYIIIGMSSLSFLLVFCCFWFFSRQIKLYEKKPYDKKPYEKIW